MTDLLKFEKNGPIATLTINRPEKRNSLLPEMLYALDSHLTEISANKDLRVLVLTGEGDKAFSTGADLTVFSTYSAEEVREKWVKDGHSIFRKLFELPQVTIAKINGDTFGGGLELALSCDLRIATDKARFGFPENRVGTAPGWNGFQRAVEIIGVSRAKELILTGTSIEASIAQNWGLINYVTSATDLNSSTENLINEILKSSPIAQRIGKQILNTFQSSQANTLMESLAGAYAHQTEDFKEGVTAFKEKRQSNFKGK